MLSKTIVKICSIVFTSHVVLGIVPIIQPFTFPNMLIEGDSTKLLCAVLKGDKPLNFKWFKDGNEIVTNSNVEILILQDSSILTIHHLNAENSGNYTCVVSNAMGVTNYTTKITVRAEPKWVLEPKDMESTLGSAITIECSASGFPFPNIIWKKLIGELFII
ncbi:Down syndrome cell adhesion molecule homolog [Centruroides sculpturatus]|uniref:Down syndrome cell adhesion molecule homolog n=1 Tax=Centruroides sculpturatus TaxID=218467 RepID=UPI000C6D3AD6|nr:Down syndrome cell adhesion molecule homolog [Centruroides sculpturatus]